MEDKRMEDERKIRDTLLDILGEDGCGMSCVEADITYDEDGWKFMLCGFMEPWKIGRTVDEARATLRELGSMGFGLA
jgi:hypothetical protein